MEWTLVHWIDIVSCEQPWLQQEEASDIRPAEMWSAGVVIHEDDHCLVLAGTVCPADNTVGNVNSIPKGVIKSTRKLFIAGPKPE